LHDDAQFITLALLRLVGARQSCRGIYEAGRKSGIAGVEKALYARAQEMASRLNGPLCYSRAAAQHRWSESMTCQVCRDMRGAGKEQDDNRSPLARLGTGSPSAVFQ
jgi:hypothetical protein